MRRVEEQVRRDGKRVDRRSGQMYGLDNLLMLTVFLYESWDLSYVFELPVIEKVRFYADGRNMNERISRMRIGEQFRESGCKSEGSFECVEFVHETRWNSRDEHDMEPDGRGPGGRGSGGRGSDGRGSNGRDPNGRGPNGSRTDGREPDRRGSDRRGSDGRGPNEKDSDGRGSDRREPDRRVPNRRGSDGRGPNERDSDGRGSVGRGPNRRESDGKGPNRRESDGRGPTGIEKDRREQDYARGAVHQSLYGGNGRDRPTVNEESEESEGSEEYHASEAVHRRLHGGIDRDLSTVNEGNEDFDEPEVNELDRKERDRARRAVHQSLHDGNGRDRPTANERYDEYSEPAEVRREDQSRRNTYTRQGIQKPVKGNSRRNEENTRRGTTSGREIIRNERKDREQPVYRSGPSHPRDRRQRDESTSDQGSTETESVEGNRSSEEQQPEGYSGHIKRAATKTAADFGNGLVDQYVPAGMRGLAKGVISGATEQQKSGGFFQPLKRAAASTAVDYANDYVDEHVPAALRGIAKTAISAAADATVGPQGSKNSKTDGRIEGSRKKRKPSGNEIVAAREPKKAQSLFPEGAATVAGMAGPVVASALGVPMLAPFIGPAVKGLMGAADRMAGFPEPQPDEN